MFHRRRDVTRLISPVRWDGVGVGIFCLEGVSLLIDVRLAVVSYGRAMGGSVRRA